MEKECPVCFEEMKQTRKTNNCHDICLECRLKIIFGINDVSPVCPICRKKFNSSKDDVNEFIDKICAIIDESNK
jgi:hypothetical protein